MKKIDKCPGGTFVLARLNTGMKLFELFEPEFKDTQKTVDYDRSTLNTKAYKDPSKDELGKGLYSRVRTDPHDPRMAIKSEKGICNR